MFVSRMTPWIVDGMVWPVIEFSILRETVMASVLSVFGQATGMVTNRMVTTPTSRSEI